ncbi:GNAT family N-acetyltransferase [Paracoccus zhejiangensis]|uniref:GNAT family N-acetyltransferase n=1 Tax=Paracoccus zhejiangensis TaxID=1077935 RepID=A0A2H5EV88_9RHOB|nr:GNAT family N-acetyltransferase [Paracoccus zhejiangensis]AUH63209.1 GNAT family N-acetyltransferase [Paracoccus zhejiangensis]
MDALTITRDSPLAADLALLFERHTVEMVHGDTPPESIHMMPRADLDRPDIAFFVLRDQTGPLAMGAVKTIAPGHGEVKSMHVLSEARGRGLSRRLLDHMLAASRADGLARLSLETGSQDSFASARGLYARAGFSECAPFGSYRPDPNSVFMTREL